MIVWVPRYQCQFTLCVCQFSDCVVSPFYTVWLPTFLNTSSSAEPLGSSAAGIVAQSCSVWGKGTTSLDSKVTNHWMQSFPREQAWLWQGIFLQWQAISRQGLRCKSSIDTSPGIWRKEYFASGKGHLGSTPQHSLQNWSPIVIAECYDILIKKNLDEKIKYENVQTWPL